MRNGFVAPRYVPKQQPDAVISQANPVSTTLYTVLDTTKNVRIIAIRAAITWNTTQPTPLEIIVTIDAIPTIFIMNNPVSATSYFPYNHPSYAANAQVVKTDVTVGAFLLEGRTVKVEVRITKGDGAGTITQLDCRMKWAKW